MKKKALFFVLWLFAFSAGSYAQLPAAYTARLQVVFDSMCNKLHARGASAAVLVPNAGTWKSAWGESEAGVPVNTDMQFALNSNTKTYTSALIFKLQENGLLTIDDTIGTWFPNQPNISGQITIRQLLNHTSGIYSYTDNPAFNDSLIEDLNRIWTPEEMLQFVQAPNFAPGTSWDYSNTNYILAGLIIKQVLGQPISTSFRNLILMPQGLDNTVFFPEETPVSVPHPWSMAFGTPYQADLINDFGYSNNAFYSSAYSAGALFSTAEDNVKFWSALISGNIINAASFQQMRTFEFLDNNTAYGMGIFRLKNFNGHQVYSHGGTGLGYINENVADSLTGVCISVLTNQDSLSNSKVQMIVRALHKVTIAPPTGIDEIAQNAQNLHLYPNPVSDVLHIQSDKIRSGLQFDLTDLTGRVLLSQKLESDVADIQTGGLANGIYIGVISKDGSCLKTEKIRVNK